LSFENILPPNTTHAPSGLSSFPEKANCHQDHDHHYCDLNQKFHFAAFLGPLLVAGVPDQVILAMVRA
jgi:hypothetical protein